MCIIIFNTIVITQDDFDSGVNFDLETHMGSDYLGSLTSTTQPQFGDEQPFPGSIRLLRAMDIEELNLRLNKIQKMLVNFQKHLNNEK